MRLKYARKNSTPKKTGHTSAQKRVEIHNTLEYIEKTKGNIPDEFICPITKDLMINPVFAADGYTYELESIKKWVDKSDKSPMTNLPLIDFILVPNYSLKSSIETWMEEIMKIKNKKIIRESRTGKPKTTSPTNTLSTEKKIHENIDEERVTVVVETQENIVEEDEEERKEKIVTTDERQKGGGNDVEGSSEKIKNQNYSSSDFFLSKKLDSSEYEELEVIELWQHGRL